MEKRKFSRDGIFLVDVDINGIRGGEEEEDENESCPL